MSPRPILLIAPTILLVSLGMVGCRTISARITVPANGSFTTDSVISVAGTATDADEVSVNGVSATVHSDGTWSAVIPVDAAKIVQSIVAIPSKGGTADENGLDRIVAFNGPSIGKEDVAPSTVALRITDQGFDRIEPVADQLVPIDFAAIVPTGTMVADTCIVPGLFGCLAGARATVIDPAPSIGQLDLLLDSETGKIAGDIGANDLVVNATFRGTGLLALLNCNVALSADSLDLSADFDLVPMQPSSQFVDVRPVGNVQAAFSGFSPDFTSGVCSFPLIENVFLIFTPLFESIALDGMSDFLNATDSQNDTPVSGAIEDALADIEIAGTVGGLIEADVFAPFFSIEEDNTGVTMGADTRFVPTCTPPAGAPVLDETLLVPSAFAPLSDFTPVGGLPYDVGLCISPTGFNQLLRAQIECGLLNVSLNEIDLGLGNGPQPVTSDLLSIIAPNIIAEFGAGRAMRVDIMPATPPFVTGNVGPAGELADLMIAHLVIRIVTDDPEARLALELAIDTRVGLDLTLNASGDGLDFSFAAPTAEDLEIVLLANPLLANMAVVNAILPLFVVQFLPSVVDQLDAFPVPGFAGLKLNVLEVGRDGDFMSLFANLSE